MIVTPRHPRPRACRRPAQTGIDADAHPDAPRDSDAEHSVSCYPLFHACTISQECCAPNRCLNITGTPACQQKRCFG
jgi:hypothetical protein